MKKIFVSLMAVAALISIASCEKNFDPKIYGSLSTASGFPASMSDYESELMLCYTPFGSKWDFSISSQQHCFYGGESTVYNIFDVASDYCLPVLHSWGGSWMRLSQCYYTELETQRRGYNGGTASHYEALRDVSRFTKIIGEFRDADESVLPAALKKQFEAEVRICRGLMMYYMLHIYGPLPFILDPAQVGDEALEAKLERPTLDEISQWIYDDFKYGTENAPETQAQRGRYTADYARVLLMRHCLNEGSHMSGWYQEAYDLKSRFTGGYKLFTDPGDSGNPYVELFRSKNDFSCEDIMAVSVDGNADGSANNTNFNPLFYYIAGWNQCAKTDGDGNPTWCAGAGNNNGWSQTMNVDTSFFDTYEPGDMRRDVIVDRIWVSNGGGMWIDRSNVGDLWDGFIINKYPFENSKNTYQDNDIPLARWADVLLMYAEAAVRKSNSVPQEAVAAVNEVRARAGLAGLTADKTASAEAFLDALLVERGHEFLYEGFRKIDLIRFGKYYQTMDALGRTPTSQYWPVPNFSVEQAKDAGYTLTQYYTRPDYDGPVK
ncbi:MAG: RagB/SusD family nutrient uptake outer membrane protein [Bacteroidales bacterium]|nr:RagB/SusD family nutrient uptake outer membrane protein [Bacteroidales bacterium]